MDIPLLPVTKGHRWRFFRAGGFDQVKIETGEDICALEQLDQKLWAALSCPTRGLHFDVKTLDLIDTDKDGRIRVPEVIAASKWVCGLLKDPDFLLRESDELPLELINGSTAEGKQILASARQTLVNLGKPEATSISIDDTTDTARIFALTRFNGDGIVPPDSTGEDTFTAGVITQIIVMLGGVADRSGKLGVDAPKVTQFFADLQAYSTWYAQAEQFAAAIWPFGKQTTETAYAAYDVVDAKIDDYFARCRLAAYDPRAQMALNRQEDEYLAIAAKDLKITADEVVGFPIARVEADKPLSLSKDLNPAWSDAIKTFDQLVVKLVVGERAELVEADWFAIKARFAAFAAWQVSKQGAAVEMLGLDRIREILTTETKTKIDALIAQDKALEAEANAIAVVDKLVRYTRDLHRLLINFVNFRDFYDSDDDKAVFQAGRLYLDQRACDLCIRVEDMAKHGALAPLSRVYLAYCDCVRKGEEKMTIVAAFTAGDSDNLMVGRNGVFYDRKGQDWDATVVKVFENPISIPQAFWSPYKRMIRWVEEQVAKKAAAADTSAADTLASATGTAMQSTVAGQAAKPKPRIDIGTVAALGVAVGGITAAMGVLLSTFFGLGMYMPLGVVGVVLTISGPSMVIAWLKLRQRNLGPLLDASGWAVNTRAKINIPFGKTLTEMAKLPLGSKLDLRDRYAESHQARYWIATTLALLLLIWAMWNFGGFHMIFPNANIPDSEWLKEHRHTPVTVVPSIKKGATATGAVETSK